MKTFAWILCLMSINVLKAQVDRYDVLIHEIMADPSPIVGLPNAEYIELKNVSGKTIDLFRFKIDNGSTTATVSSSYLLLPDSMVVLCSRTQTIFFGDLKTIGLSSFPALGNEGDLITLKAPDGKTIHAVAYQSDWYSNPVKANGGWSLEMIDPLQPCARDNWMASLDAKGGTPGKENSVVKMASGSHPLQGLQCITLSADKLLLKLDQGVDSISALSNQCYQLIGIDAKTSLVKIMAPLFRDIELTLDKKLEPEKIYTLMASGLKHCRSNRADTLSIRTGILKDPIKGDLVINEILFDPPSNGSDFVEIRNNSKSVINAKGLLLAPKNEWGVLGTGYTVSSDHFNIFPGEAVAISTDTGFIRYHWKSSPPAHLIQTGSLPSLADDKGHIVLLNAKAEMVDEFKYTDDMHFPLIKDRSAVSLERVNPFAPSSFLSNWQSAAASAGHGTPGQENSQYLQSDSLDATIIISPHVMSPNNDGKDDLLQISYQFEIDGYMMNAYLFNERGQFLCKLVDNQLCGTRGDFYWNGLRNNQRLPDGLYIIMTEMMRMNAKPLRFRKLIGIRSG
jgi:hypothetical protein